MIITLTPDIERKLTERACKLGLTPEQLALDSLRERFAPAEPAITTSGGQTLREFLEGYIAVLDSSEYVPGGARMSENTGRKFATGLLERHRQGKR